MGCTISLGTPKDPNIEQQDPDTNITNDARFQDCYTLSRKLGEGAFSTVMLGAKRGTSNQYAVKVICKVKLSARNQSNLQKEIEILRLVKSPRIIELHEVYGDIAYYYLVTELMLGGELFDRIVKKECYLESDARNVCRSLFAAIAHCHSHKVAHRDLKPENLLLTSMGSDSNIKIGDFGFATIATSEKCLRTQCGTPAYVAPEILTGESYGTKADCWSLGVITYVLLGGYLPFHEPNRPQLFQKVCSGEFEFHREYWLQISKEAKNLITELLIVDPKSRITAHEALNHPWLTRDFDNPEPLSDNLNRMRKFNATRKLRAAVHTVIALDKFTSLGFQLQEDLALRNIYRCVNET